MNHKRRLLAFAAGLSAVAVASVAGASSSSAAPTGATTLAAPAGKVTIWTDADRKAAVDRVASAWGAARGIDVDVVQKDFGKIRDDLKTVERGDRSRRDRRRARLDRRARGQRPRAPALPVARDAGAVPAVRARRVLVRHGRQAPLRRPGRDREHRPRRQHEAREGADELRRPRRRRRSRSRGRSRGNLAIAVQQGDERRRVPHVPVLLGPLRLRVRHEPRRQPRPVGHRRSTRRGSSATRRRSTRGTRPASSTRRSTTAPPRRVPQGQGGLLDHRPVERRTASRRRASASDRPDAEDPAATRCRSSASRASWSRSSPSNHGVESAAKDLVGNYMMSQASQTALAAANGRYPANTRRRARVSGPDAEGSSASPARGGVAMPNIPQMSAVWSDLGVGVGEVDEGLRRHAGAGVLRDRGPQHREQDRLARIGAGRLRAPRPLSPTPMATTSPPALRSPPARVARLGVVAAVARSSPPSRARSASRSRSRCSRSSTRSRVWAAYVLATDEQWIALADPRRGDARDRRGLPLLGARSR